MTMDVQNDFRSYKESSPETKESAAAVRAKRSFDVAFLMMPDEKLRQRQLRVSKQLFEAERPFGKTPEGAGVGCCNARGPEDDKTRSDGGDVSPGFGSDANIDVGTDEYPSGFICCSDSENSDKSRSRPNSNESAARPSRRLPDYRSQVFDDPRLSTTRSKPRFDGTFSPRSAFTKVTNYSLRSPDPSASPDDLLYQNSVSPPPSAPSPTSGYVKPPGLSDLLNPVHLLGGNNFFKSHGVPPPTNFIESGVRRSSRDEAAAYSEKLSERKPSPNELRYHPFRPEMPYLRAGASYPFGIQHFQSNHRDFSKFPAPPREPAGPLLANPAAALLSTLLPPTLAAFSLPAQNVCAKCSISFRMTSDLVYHMRTHHKSEQQNDPGRRKREDKLKCPVCNENFRERHHLTRHMTAHQDKEGDSEESVGAAKNKQFYGLGSGSLVHK